MHCRNKLSKKQYKQSYIYSNIGRYVWDRNCQYQKPMPNDEERQRWDYKRKLSTQTIEQLLYSLYSSLFDTLLYTDIDQDAEYVANVLIFTNYYKRRWRLYTSMYYRARVLLWIRQTVASLKYIYVYPVSVYLHVGYTSVAPYARYI